MDVIAASVSKPAAPAAAPLLDRLDHDPHALVAPPIINYLQFLNLWEIGTVHKILIANNIISHNFFWRGSSLVQAEVSGLGLTLGVVTALFDNVSRYDLYLSHLRWFCATASTHSPRCLVLTRMVCWLLSGLTMMKPLAPTTVACDLIWSAMHCSRKAAMLCTGIQKGG